MSRSDLILVADIGGTNTRVALGDRDGRLHNIRALKNSAIRDLQEPLAETMAAAAVTDAVLAIAGPVDSDVVSVTNHPWTISKPVLERTLGLRNVTLINDFLAAAFAMPALGEEDLATLQTGEHRTGNILVCGPGTGFGTAALIHSSRGLIGVASEAGHAVLGATNEAEEAIFHRLRTDGHLSIETVLSGAGLSRVHRAMTGNTLGSSDIIALANTGDAGANEAVSFFLKVFGRVAGDLALAYDAASGVFLAGGVARALAARYKDSPFLAAFSDHPPYSERLSKMPIAAVLLRQPGLLGALHYALARAA